MKALQQIMEQIAELSVDVKIGFQHLGTAVEWENCKNRYFTFENDILFALDKMKAWKATPNTHTYNDFIEACDQSKCDKAVTAILNSLAGQSGLLGCDMA